VSGSPANQVSTGRSSRPAELHRSLVEALAKLLLADLERPTDGRGDASSNVTGERQPDGPAP
jgi:hypothetical protein